MPDFEIRYFHADGKLALVHVTAHASLEEAHAHARTHIGDHARFELRDGAGRPLALPAT
jgi:hypothetical protein